MAPTRHRMAKDSTAGLLRPALPRRPLPRPTAALSCLALALLTTACSPDPRPPTRAMARDLLASLDQAFNGGSHGAYDRLFRGNSFANGHGAAFARTMQLFDQAVGLSQSSTLEDFAAFEQHGVALTQTAVGLAATNDPQSNATAVSHHAYLVFADTGGGPRGLLHLDVDAPARKHVSKTFTGRYTCPPCNFRIGDDSLRHWLVVPSPKTVSGCAEMVTFYRLGADLQLTIAISRNPGRLAAPELLRQLVRSSPKGPAEVAVEPWEAPGLTLEFRAGVHAARCQLQEAGGRQVTLHLITRSTGDPIAPGAPAAEISYLLTVAGAAEAQQAHRGEVELWLKSFSLLTVAKGSELVGLASVAAHSGGEVHADGRYENERHGLSCRGPADWHPMVQADRCLFRVAWECPRGRGQLMLTGFSLSVGEVEQRRAHIDELVRCRIGEIGHTLANEPVWSTPPDPNPWNALASMRLDTRAADQPGPLPRRMGQILLYDELWVLVDASIQDENVVPLFDAMVASVRRH